MAQPPIDYDKLAAQHGGKPADVDYDALASEVTKPANPVAPAQQGTPIAAVEAYKAIGNMAIGAAKGVGNTVFGLGKMVRDYTPIGRISDAIQPGAFDQKPPELEPSNSAQRVGYTAEQVGEFFTPVGAPGRAKRAIDIAKSAGVTMAQTGSPAAAGVSGAVTAALPAAGAAARMGGRLQQSAEKSVAQALGATKEWAKDKAGRIAPEMIERGVRGSRETMLAQASANARAVASRLDDAYAAATAAGTTIEGQLIRGELQLAKDSLMVAAANGRQLPIPGTERVVRQLDRLDQFVDRLGPTIPVDKARHVKSVWGRIVDKAGLFGPKAGASATDNADAWALREGTGAFKALLDDASTDIATLNKEYTFWKGLKDVLKETEKRTQSQGGGLTAGITASAGAASGFASGDNIGDSLTRAFAGAAAGRQFVRLVQSPWWRTSVSAPLKSQMARALASGSQQHATSVLSRMMQALPSQARQAFAQ